MFVRAGFWRRQCLEPPTPYQKGYDVVFGIIAPIVCVVADPCVFKAGGAFPQPWISHATAAYVFIALQILTLTAWLAIPRKGPILTLALAGPLFAGGLASIGLGIRLLPLSLIGLLILIGVLGFTPFLTGIVYLRNGVRAWRSIPEQDRSEFHRGIAVFFAFFTMALAIAGQWVSDRSMSELIANPDSAGARRVVRWAGGGGRAGDLFTAWKKETNPVRKEQLAKTYLDVTGRTVEDEELLRQ